MGFKMNNAPEVKVDMSATHSVCKADSNPVSLSDKKIHCIFTLVLMIPTAGCAVLLGFTVSGHLLKVHSFECGSGEEDAARLQRQTLVLYLVIAPSLLLCLLGVLQVWWRNRYVCKMLKFGVCVLSLAVFYFCVEQWVTETKEHEEFRSRYFALLPLPETRETTENCSLLYNLNQWQAEYKCCGLINGHRDWKFPIPDSCSCDRGDGSATCVSRTTLYSDKQHILVYEKSCLPTVMSRMKARNSTFWAVLIIWSVFSICVGFFTLVIAILQLIIGCFFLLWCCEELAQDCVYYWGRYSGEKEMVPVVYVRKPTTNNNTEIEDKTGGEGAIKGCEKGRVDEDVDRLIEGDGAGKDTEEEETKGRGEEKGAEEEDDDENPVRFIPLSELRRLQEELDPPPLELQGTCNGLLSNKTEPFYMIQLDEGSPLLPSGTVLVDATKPRMYFWDRGPYCFLWTVSATGLD